MRQFHDLLDGHDGAERVRHLGDGHDLGAVVQQLLVFVQQHLARVVHRNHADLRALGGSQLLPRHDVGVVFEVADDDLVTRTDVLAAPAFGHQVDGLGGAAHKDDFVHIRRVDEFLHPLTGAFVGVGGAGGEFMRGAVDVRVFVLVKIRDAVDDGLRLVGRGGVVEPHQRLAVHPLAQDGEVAPDGVHVERRVGRMVCLRRRTQRLHTLDTGAQGVGLGRCGVAAGKHDCIDEVVLRRGQVLGVLAPSPLWGEGWGEGLGRWKCCAGIWLLALTPALSQGERGQYHAIASNGRRMAVATVQKVERRNASSGMAGSLVGAGAGGLGHTECSATKAGVQRRGDGHRAVGQAVARLCMRQQGGCPVGQMWQMGGRRGQQVHAGHQALRNRRARHTGANSGRAHQG